MNFELSQEQIEISTFAIINGYKIEPFAFDFVRPTGIEKCNGFKLSKGKIEIKFTNHKRYYSIYLSKFGGIIHGDFQIVKDFIEKSELPINHNIENFREFLHENRYVIDGRIEEIRDLNFNVYNKNINICGFRELVLTFNFNKFKDTGINLKTLLMELLSCKNFLVKKFKDEDIIDDNIENMRDVSLCCCNHLELK